MRLLRRTELSSDTSPGCIGVKDGKIHTITLAFSQEELQGAEIIDAE
jgi:dihydropyrimidinase